jgi:hypothetical protein
MKLIWREDCSPGFTRELSSIGGLTCSITVGGAASLGRNIYVGELCGDVVAISPTAEACEDAIIRQAARELSMLEAELRLVV